MKLAVSHIAWPPEMEEEAMDRLKDLGIDTLELAPLRAFGDLHLATEASVKIRADWYRERGFSISSFQALLFGSHDAFLFGAPSSRGNLVETLKQIGRIAGWCGAGPLVFGSPKNRFRGEISINDAMEQASAIFREVGDACAEAGSCLVIEANPPAYGADFINTLEEAAELVGKVNSPGFALHLDAGGFSLSGETFEPVVQEHAKMIRHAHLSQPHLGDFAAPDPALARMKRALEAIGYDGTVAIEMRQQPEIWSAIELAVERAREL